MTVKSRASRGHCGEDFGPFTNDGQVQSPLFCCHCRGMFAIDPVLNVCRMYICIYTHMYIHIYIYSKYIYIYIYTYISYHIGLSKKMQVKNVDG